MNARSLTFLLSVALLGLPTPLVAGDSKTASTDETVATEGVATGSFDVSGIDWAPGASVIVSAKGLKARDKVAVYFDGALIKRLAADALGTVAKTSLVIPAKTTQGTHRFVFKTDRSGTHARNIQVSVGWPMQYLNAAGNPVNHNESRIGILTVGKLQSMGIWTMLGASTPVVSQGKVWVADEAMFEKTLQPISWINSAGQFAWAGTAATKGTATILATDEVSSTMPNAAVKTISSINTATGRIGWTKKLSTKASNIGLVDDLVYYTTESQEWLNPPVFGRLHLVNASDGVERRSFHMGFIRSDAHFSISGNTIVTTLDSSGQGKTNVVAYNRNTGQTMWDVQFACCMGKPVIDGGRVYVGSRGQATSYQPTYGNGKIYALDLRNGSTIWAAPQKYGSLNTDIRGITVAYGRVYATICKDTQNIGYNTSYCALVSHEQDTGQVRWMKAAKSKSQKVTVANGLVFTVGDDERTIEAYEALNGTLLWKSVKLYDYPSSTIVVVNGRVYVTDVQGNFYVFSINGKF